MRHPRTDGKGEGYKYKERPGEARRARAGERHGGGDRERARERERERERDTVLGTMRTTPILFSEIPISHGFDGEIAGRRDGAV